jgi:hypothetical protein
MPQHQATSGQFAGHVNPADGVGSLKHGSRTHPAHAEGRLVYNGADRDGQNGNPGSMILLFGPCSIAAFAIVVDDPSGSLKVFMIGWWRGTGVQK